MVHDDRAGPRDAPPLHLGDTPRPLAACESPGGHRPAPRNAKVVILAGGFGTRLAEETESRPKPMVDIGGRPILWHIMKMYSAHGFNDFIICLGYKGYFIKEYFSNFFLHSSDVTFNLRDGTSKVHKINTEPWTVTLIDTGEDTMIGGRIKRILPYVDQDAYFLLTYGDGLGDIDISAVVELHQREGRLATVTATQPPGRFGALEIDGNRVNGFTEKPTGNGGWINGGFFVLSPRVGDYIEGDRTVWEKEPLEHLAAAGQLSVYQHHGFWQPMDTLRDKRQLEAMWADHRAPWKFW
jgi:glucose-1-phosphate cytidylyltransferase